MESKMKELLPLPGKKRIRESVQVSRYYGKPKKAQGYDGKQLYVKDLAKSLRIRQEYSAK